MLQSRYSTACHRFLIVAFIIVQFTHIASIASASSLKPFTIAQVTDETHAWAHARVINFDSSEEITVRTGSYRDVEITLEIIDYVGIDLPKQLIIKQSTSHYRNLVNTNEVFVAIGKQGNRYFFTIVR